MAKQNLSNGRRSQRREDCPSLEDKTGSIVFVSERSQNSSDVEPCYRSLDERLFGGRNDGQEDLEGMHVAHESSVGISLNDAEVKTERIELGCLVMGWFVVPCESNGRVSIGVLVTSNVGLG